MRVLKRILIGCGSVFIVLVALFTWLGVQSVRFKRDERPFVEAYVGDLSRSWNVADVYSRSDKAFISQAASADGQRVIQGFRALGSLTAIQDFELKNYSNGTWGRRAVFDFEARFQHGEALMEVIVVDKGDGAGARVLGVHLTNIQIDHAGGGKLTA